MSGKINMKALRENIGKEIKRQLDSGMPVRFGDETGVYDLYPDGRKVYISNESDKKSE